MTEFPSTPSAAILLLFQSLFLCLIPGVFSSGVVTLKSIEIFKTHELFNSNPTVYFHCQGENKTTLPDVKKKHLLYIFKGEESWQPLTELADRKCKRCGFYEKDVLKPDDIFEEWEFCPSDFTSPDGIYIRFKEKEFNATFLCPHCVPLETGSNHGSHSHDEGSNHNKTNVGLVIAISGLILIVLVVGGVVAYKYWKRKKREHDQARFLKLFEDGDDIEDELGLGDVI